MKRRGFVIAGSAALFSTGLGWWAEAKRGNAASGQPGLSPHEGELVEDPKGLLDLRPGFKYRVLQRGGATMSDGYRVPGRPDAMGCFDLGDGRWALMRNHELGKSAQSMSAYPNKRAPKEAYDPHGHGGVTRVVLDVHGKVLSSNLVLTGTSRNCAGGMSPWGWLTCEDSVEEGHGHVFLCATEATRVRPPLRIEAYGRFLHEAVAIDPDDHTAYLTEDRADGCLYRYVPRDRADPFGPGQLQAMAIDGRPRFKLGNDLPPNAQLRVRWLDVPAKEGEKDNLRYASQERGAAVVTRGEGIWRLDDGFAFTSTTGGPIASGQIFHLKPTREGGALRLIAQANDQGTLDMPDNLTVTPWGDLMVCEDNMRAPFLRLVTQRGRVLPFAFNRATKSEFAGVCFSPDGEILFVNIQEQNLTLAIEGPWATLRGA
ncbi:MAG TPA: alkaline phosphatase PhoX [Polyangiales bacterium]|nr:alkaline phosphatase PhoX [Polyangiales bacterium]